MIGINITKFSSFTEHYYCRFYQIYDINILQGLREGFHIIGDIGIESYEKSIPDFKAKTEKELMIRAKKIIDDYYGEPSEVWFVCYEGKYSESRTKFINSL